LLVISWFGFSKNLAKLGWQVDVVTASPHAADAPIPGVTVHVRNRSATLNDRYNAFKEKRKTERAGYSTPVSNGATQHPASGTTASAPFVAQQLYALRKFLGASLSFPDKARGWIFRAATTARQLIDTNDYSLVISSGPPHSAHIAGVLATIGRRVPHWADFRDPWTGSVRNPSLKKAAGANSPYYMLQNLVFSRVARIIVNNEGFARALGEAEPQLTLSVVPNGVDVDVLPKRGADRFDGWSVAHVGTLYAGRSVTSVVAALRTLFDRRPDVASRFKLRLVGPMDPAHRSRFHADLAEAGIGDAVEITEWLPRADALNVLNRSHLALVLAQNQPLCVPAKLYECVGCGVPTLTIAEPGSASARESARIGAYVADPNDVAAIAQVFEDVVNGKTPSTIQTLTPISYEGITPALDHLLRTEIARGGADLGVRAAAQSGR
jgi:glycosyltransferase involved in cell wall biosynthesis